MRRILGLVAILSCLAATACGSDPDDRTPGTAPFSIPVGEPSYDPTAATWAVRGTIHVCDTVLEVQPRPEAYVVTRRGVYHNARGALCFTDGGAAKKVAEVGGVGLAVDPEQQRLALVDRAHGATDPFDTDVAVPVVFDLETGDQVLRAEPGRSLEDDDDDTFYGAFSPGGSVEGPAGRTTMTACELADRPTCTRLAPDIELPVGTSPKLLFGTGRPGLWTSRVG